MPARQRLFLGFCQEFLHDLGVFFHQQLAADLVVWGSDCSNMLKSGKENKVQNHTVPLLGGGRNASTVMAIPRLLSGNFA